VTEPFSRAKVVSGVRKACQGRPVDEDAIALLAQRVEEAIRARGAAEVPSHDVGLEILGPLRDLDEVAYLRFASVYRSFESLGDFEREIAELRSQARRGAGGDDDAGPEQVGANELENRARTETGRGGRVRPEPVPATANGNGRAG